MMGNLSCGCLSIQARSPHTVTLQAECRLVLTTKQMCCRSQHAFQSPWGWLPTVPSTSRPALLCPVLLCEARTFLLYRVTEGQVALIPATVLPPPNKEAHSETGAQRGRMSRPRSHSEGGGAPAAAVALHGLWVCLLATLP